MGWELSTWLALGRSFQLLGSLAAVCMHGYLTIKVFAGKLGLSEEMVVLEVLICVIFGYSTLCLFVNKRTKKTSWLTTSIVCDLILCGFAIGIVTTLAHAGLPVHCAGMTELDADGNPRPLFGFTTIGFSDESSGHNGELDRFCGFERSFYSISSALIFTYIFTVTVTVLRIWEKKYTRNTKVNELLESLERAQEVSMKVADRLSPLGASPLMTPPPPSSEGIITRNTSLRSNFTAATSAAASHAGSYASEPLPRRPPLHAVASSSTTPIIRRPVPPLSTPPATATANPLVGFVPVPIDEDDDADAEAALVADGMQHQPGHHFRQQPQHHQQQFHPQQQQQHQPQQPMHQHQRHPSRDLFPRMPMLSEESQLSSADDALVSDGMRPSEPMLPPYQPGNRRMSGHGADEDNEMRLSGYVKGQTRAQEMKDSGRY